MDGQHNKPNFVPQSDNLPEAFKLQTDCKSTTKPYLLPRNDTEFNRLHIQHYVTRYVEVVLLALRAFFLLLVYTGKCYMATSTPRLKRILRMVLEFSMPGVEQVSQMTFPLIYGSDLGLLYIYV
ncbi:hypothetical protein BC936DRAFT_140362 [Jimgerdemannia flammicorona]|uniref:Uncharacterized protein n=1 Tax=Jimgerdemannia flammicorona TaxID=994334 RepID=A0A433DGW8_9FUNG|nr:hypothetical protein BC936DRAFT_140362 [Jimgerdemannia flammicorona]